MNFILAMWEKMITFLEDLEDSKEIRRQRERIQKGEEKTISWEQAKVELRAGGVNV